MTICHSGPNVAITQLSPKWSGLDSGLKVECLFFVQCFLFVCLFLFWFFLFVCFVFPSCEFFAGYQFTLREKRQALIRLTRKVVFSRVLWSLLSAERFPSQRIGLFGCFVTNLHVRDSLTSAFMTATTLAYRT